VEKSYLTVDVLEDEAEDGRQRRDEFRRIVEAALFQSLNFRSGIVVESGMLVG
jgi:hypothetical protein